MESTINKGAEETFLKIDTIWSEADENYECVSVKEEIVSDFEPDCNENDEKDESAYNGDNVESIAGENEDDHHITTDNSIIKPWKSVKKKMKSKSSGLCTDEYEIPIDPKSCCIHDSKTFKIINRRLRCGGCRSLVCPECFKIMFSTLHNHFLGLDESNTCLFFCKFCYFPFQSICALQAHIRIHTMETPYICPDCGLIYSNAYFLILHLINKCFHVYKSVSYKCQRCPGIYFTTEKFLQHIQDIHLNCIFRCSYCSLLFNNSEEFNNHMDNSHQKQKVQYLNYFRCSLCSDMVIPSFMYEKHIDQHRENSDSYEVEYKCLCGDVFNLIGTFRNHIQFCDKKGVIPPNWAFLQKNLKNQDLLQVETYKEKEELVGQSKLTSSVHISDYQLHNVKLCKKDEKLESRMTDVLNDWKEQSTLPFSEGNKLKDGTVDLSHNESYLDYLNSARHGNKLFNGGLSVNADQDVGACSKPEDVKGSDKRDPKSLKEMAKSCVPGQGGRSRTDCQVEIFSLEEGKNVRGTDERCIELKAKDMNAPKISYDYIPCDHLGYLKAQGPKSVENESTVILEESSETKTSVPTSTSNFHLVMELDEKTGLMVSKKILIENVDEDNGQVQQGSCEIENSNNDDPPGKFYSNEKGKSKGGNSFFTCPFCIVLFPKHSSTFQQFKLHLEYYHTDAALNIPVNANRPDTNSGLNSNSNSDNNDNHHRSSVNNGTDNDNDNNSNSSSSSNIVRTDVDSSNHVDDHTRNKISMGEWEELPMKMAVSESSISQVAKSVIGGQASGDGSRWMESTEKDDAGRTRKLQEEKRTGECDKDESKGGNSKSSPFDVYWTVKLSVKSNSDEDEKQEKTETDGTKDGETPEKADDATGRDALEASSETNLKRVSPIRKLDCKNKSKRMILEGSELAKETRGVRSGEEKKGSENETRSGYEGPKGSDKEKRNWTKKDKAGDSLGEKGKGQPDTNASNEDEWDNSKEPTWTNASDAVGPAYQKSGRGDDDDSVPSVPRLKTSEKSKRESEVWSEFYESLQLAEKLKKNKKNKKGDSAEEKYEAKRNWSTLTDYSSKRIVKKPKRYRQSSESEFSYDENENSNSDDELEMADTQLEGEDRPEGKVGKAEDECLGKKAKLLSKLENIDEKVVDYLFDLVTRKEKCLELYKKHSRLRASRYGHDLRSYRKKVLHGIKLRDRSMKLLRCQDWGKRDEVGAEPWLKGLEAPGRPPKKNSEGQENKTGERRRGRPRKILDSAKLKERRRSNKEVDFIEKNFEREESGWSPSKRKRKLSSKLQFYKKISLPDDKEDFASGQVITSKMTDVNRIGKSCAICKEVFPEPKQFRSHIIQHRLEENTYQCMECGECFVVRPSLEKHLHAFHKIKNTDRYIVENECCNSKKEALEPDNEPLKENQCKVCKNQFERAIDLTKHFRIHGMAFLKEFKKDARIKL